MTNEMLVRAINEMHRRWRLTPLRMMRELASFGRESFGENVLAYAREILADLDGVHGHAPA